MKNQNSKVCWSILKTIETNEKASIDVRIRIHNILGYRKVDVDAGNIWEAVNSAIGKELRNME